ncbi:MAG: ATP-binding protein [Chloroflexota bacterium]|nr:ATP-binding protein [Chloroflexota bacterium]
MDQQEALAWVETVQTGRFEGAEVEVKAAHRGLPSRLYETLSAFANHTGGGVVILGLDEAQDFATVGVGDPQQTLADLSNQASRMEPPIRLNPVVVPVEEQPVVVFEVPECDYQHKPCYYSEAGMNSGSYIRVGNTNRRMTDYEIFTYVSSRGQPTFDQEAVRDATIEALDRDLLKEYLNQVRQEKPRLWERLRLGEKSFAERLCALNIAVQANEAIHPTLAGLLVFGLWTQRYFPSLTITFVRYRGTEPGVKGPRGERFLDNRKFEGRLDEMVDDAVQRVITNMRHGTLIDGVFHRTILEYPEEAVREAIVNAVAHRDYSPLAQGSHVRIEMYADRLMVFTPGGLHGPVNEDNLEEELATRNQLLMRLLEETGLVENRGSGIPMMITSMREAHLEPPQFHDTRASFRVIFKNHTLLDPETVTWLNQFALYPLIDAQRMALAYLRINRRMTNSDYRRLNNTTTVEATRELRGLVDLGLIEMHGTRRWAYYTLSVLPQPREVQPVSDEERILAYLQEHEAITNSECRELLGLGDDERRARYVLSKMVKRELIRKVGEKRWTRYELV